MGGQAFATAGVDGAPLKVSRMPLDLYERLASEIQSKLVTIFRNVTIPHEAPGKQDFGDIDFLVEGSLCPWTPQMIKEAIGAAYLVENGRSNHFAVPSTDSSDQFAQVDVEICPANDTPDGAELFEWTRFFKSYSDLFQIIGICHRSLGITCNDRGLHVRVQEIEPYHRKKSLLFLTDDPNKTMEFFGLDSAKYWAGFSTEEELFEWVANGRFFNPGSLADRKEKSNDRQRHQKRSMYRNFMEEFVPSLPQAEAPQQPWTRHQVLEEALNMFDKRQQYGSMMAEHESREKELAIWERVKESLPIESKSSRTTAVKSLRRWVDFKEGQPFITSEALIEGENQPLWSNVVNDEDSILVWVRQHWQEIRAFEKARAVSLGMKEREWIHSKHRQSVVIGLQSSHL